MVLPRLPFSLGKLIKTYIPNTVNVVEAYAFNMCNKQLTIRIQHDTNESNWVSGWCDKDRGYTIIRDCE